MDHDGVLRFVLAVASLAGVLWLSACGSAPGAFPISLSPSGPAQPVPGGDPDRGAQAIRAYGCGACHIVPGVAGAQGAVGPTLAGFAGRSYIAGTLPNTPDALIRWIQQPQSIQPGSAMPDLGVTDNDALDIAAYLYLLR